MRLQIKNPVTEVPARPTDEAATHFRARLAFETDCWDVHATGKLDERGFVLIDVRSPRDFAAGHLPGAVNIPYQHLTERRLAEYPDGALFVTYCAGPHCNGSTRGALRIAELGRPVKEMIGGVTGWLENGYALETS